MNCFSLWQLCLPAVALLMSSVAVAFAGERPSSPAAAPRLDAWRIIGPGGGGAQFNPAISPHDPDFMFVSSDMTGGYVSRDGGDSWRMFNLRGVPRFFAFDPVDPDTAYTKTCGLWRTTDRGRTWQLVYPDPGDVVRIVQADDHAQERIMTKEGRADSVDALAVDPAGSKTLYAAISGGDSSRLARSSDWGKTWETLAALPWPGRRIYIDPASPGRDRKVYVIGRNALSVLEAGVLKNYDAPEGVRVFNGASAAFDKSGELVVYAVSGEAWRATADSVAGIFLSRDGGATWTRVDGPISNLRMEGARAVRFQAVAAAPSDPDIAYVSYKNLITGPSEEENFLGVAKTNDRGRTWELVWKDTYETPGPNTKSAWLNERFGPKWGENPFDLAVAPGDADICIGTDFGRTMRTTDGGETWAAVYSKRVPGGGWTTAGLDVTCCYAVHFDPFDADHMFISYTDTGLEESRDGGTSWSSATTSGVPDGWLNSTYWVEFDPEVEGLVWAGMSGSHDLPRPKMWRGRDPIDYDGGVLTSTDGGTTWTVTNTGIERSAVTHVLLEPESPAGGRTLYACGFGKGVFKSTDNGATWTMKNRGIEGREPLCWRLSRASDGALYVVVIRRSETGSETGPDAGGAVYRSRDGAESWENLPLPEGCNGPTSLAIDPGDPKRLCMSAWGHGGTDAGDEGGGIYLSSDAGATWKNVYRRDQHVHDVTIDERNGAYYACGFESSAYRSTDRGETWERLRGYNFKWGRKVVPDPRDESMVFVTTFGGSVWYGPAAGDPSAVEDIVTPAAAFSHDR